MNQRQLQFTLSIAISTIIVYASAFAQAQERVSISAYIDGDATKAQTVCEPISSDGSEANCYFVNKFREIIKPDSKTVVEVTELITKIPLNRSSQTQLNPLYVKLNWKSARAGNIEVAIDGQLVIKGQILRLRNGDTKFEVAAIPNMSIGDFFMPDMDLADYFQLNGDTDADEIKIKTEVWVEQMLTPLFQAYFTQVAAPPRIP
jgi:hypothetical protein